MKLILASHNEHKATEIKAILLPFGVKVLSLSEINYVTEIEETGSTLEENAQLKAIAISKFTSDYVLADDSGLEVESLGNAPGVISARYAGVPSNSENNIALLLKNLSGITNRFARFRTVLAIAKSGVIIQQFEGKIEGEITLEPSGKDGFGYDPIFVPTGYKQTFAEMNALEKNQISHRANALAQLVNWIKSKRG